jgi:hypothetical protein
MGALQKKRKEGFHDPCSISNFVRSQLVVSLVVVLIGLVVSLISKFWGHDGTYESNHFLGQRRKMMMITTLASTLASTGNQTMKVRRPKEGGFCVTFSLWVLFCGGFFSPFFFL